MTSATWVLVIIVWGVAGGPQKTPQYTSPAITSVPGFTEQACYNARAAIDKKEWAIGYCFNQTDK